MKPYARSVSITAGRRARPSFPAVSASGSPSPGRLSGRPAIVLADEPTGNLDSTNSQAILELLDALHEGGATILVITHERAIADRLPRQIELLDGRIVADSVRADPVASRSGPPDPLAVRGAKVPPPEGGGPTPWR